MSVLEFAPNFTTAASFRGLRTIDELEAERGVYSATPQFVRAHCGPIAHEILALVPGWYFDEAASLGLFPNIDVRIHRLYPGDVPAYPGWHCDGEYRETYFAQPDLDKIKVSRHLTATVSSFPEGVSNTQFLDQPFSATIEDTTSERTLWGQVHEQVECVQSRRLHDTRDGELVLFDARTIHRAMPAKVRGWRLFFRMSMWHRPNLGDGGKITRQEQVYKLAEGGGW